MPLPRSRKKGLRTARRRLITSCTHSVCNQPHSIRSHIFTILRVFCPNLLVSSPCLISAGYMKAVKKKMEETGKSEEEIKEFEISAAAYAKKIVGDFKDYDFYVGESMDPDGMLVFFHTL
jgi:hypothetical protein